jgi:hypothetical protein
MDVNSDFRDLLQCLNDAGARYLVVGAYAVIFYTHPRYTKDLDIWVEGTSANVERVWNALAAFGAPLRGVAPHDLAKPDMIFQIGLAPNRIDIITSIRGVTFDTAWKNRRREHYGDQPVSFLGVDELIRNKLAVGRPHDLEDVRHLRRARRLRRRPRS